MRALPPEVARAVLPMLERGEKILFASPAEPEENPADSAWGILTTHAMYLGTAGSLRRNRLEEIVGIELDGPALSHGAMIVLTRARTSDMIQFEVGSRSGFEELAVLARKEIDRRGGKRVDPFAYQVSTPEGGTRAGLGTLRSSPLERVGRSGGRPEVRIELPRESTIPGGVIEGALWLSWPSQRPVRGVRVIFRGIEETRERVATGKGSVMVRSLSIVTGGEEVLFGSPSHNGGWAVLRDALRTLAGKQRHPSLAPGLYRGKFRFRVPRRAPPSYRSLHIVVSYEVKAWVDIPLAFDMISRKQVLVRPAEPARWPAVIGRFELDPIRLPHPLPNLRVSLEAGEGGGGKPIVGSFRIENCRNREIRAAAVAIGKIEAAGSAGRAVHLWSRIHGRRISRARLDKGGWIPFELPDPGELPVFRSARSRCDLGVEIRVKIAGYPGLRCVVPLTGAPEPRFP